MLCTCVSFFAHIPIGNINISPIGYGKGFYDRFLNEHNIPTIGLCYKECLIDKIDNDEFDYKVERVITD